MKTEVRAVIWIGESRAHVYFESEASAKLFVSDVDRKSRGGGGCIA